MIQVDGPPWWQLRPSCSRALVRPPGLRARVRPSSEAAAGLGRRTSLSPPAGEGGGPEGRRVRERSVESESTFPLHAQASASYSLSLSHSLSLTHSLSLPAWSPSPRRRGFGGWRRPPGSGEHSAGKRRRRPRRSGWCGGKGSGPRPRCCWRRRRSVCRGGGGGLGPARRRIAQRPGADEGGHLSPPAARCGACSRSRRGSPPWPRPRCCWRRWR
jgi:hypothetical protein